MGLGQALSEEFVVERGVPVTETLKSLHIIPPTGMPAGRGHHRRGAAARRAVRREGRRRGRARPDRGGRRRRALRLRRDPAHATADEGLAGGAGRRAAPRRHRAARMIVTSLDPLGSTRRPLGRGRPHRGSPATGARLDCAGVPRHAGQRLRPHAPLLRARARHAVRARAADATSCRSCSGSGGGSTARSTRIGARVGARRRDGGAARRGRRR